MGEGVCCEAEALLVFHDVCLAVVAREAAEGFRLAQLLIVYASATKLPLGNLLLAARVGAALLGRRRRRRL